MDPLYAATAALACTLTACAADPTAIDDDARGASLGADRPTGSDAATSGSGDPGRDVLVDSAGLPSCVAPDGVNNAPQSIAQFVELVNALPRPTTLPCFLSSLQRPLSVSATDSILSLQPAEGPRNPRLFIFSGPVIGSVALEGEGRQLLELGQLVSDMDSLKAEIEFPVTDTLLIGAVFERILLEGGMNTKCAFCHGNEFRAPAFGEHAFVSAAVKPRAGSEVELASARQLFQDCEVEVEPDRCAMLSAIFGHGEVLQAEFPYGLQPLF